MSPLAGTGHLVRLILRRDRLIMPLWIIWLAAMPANFAAAFPGLYPSAADRDTFAQTSNANAALVALYGPVHSADVGGLVAWRISIATVIVALISLLTVIRHTRVEEEAGRRELLGAAPIGRYAGLAAALTVTCAANLLLAGGVAAGLSAQGLPLAGSVALGVQFAAAGWVFAGVGAVAAQLTTGAGAARGIAAATLGGAVLARIAGDLSSHTGGPLGWLSWVTPLGWLSRLRPYADDSWWILGPVVAASAALVGVAVVLTARRDLGAGLLATGTGPAVGGPRLGGPLALAWRLHRGQLAGWTAGLAGTGLVLGGVAGGVGDMFTDNPTLRDLFARLGGDAGLVDLYLAAMLGLLGMGTAGYAISAVLRLRAEETSQRAEPVLATAVSRLRWAASHLAFVGLGPAVVLAGAGLAMGATHAVGGGQGRDVWRVLAGALVQLPAVWLLAAVAFALVGLAPRLTGLAWAVLAVAVSASLFGAILRLPQPLRDLSPFSHLPSVPGGAVSAWPLIWLSLLTAGFAVAGLVGLRRRDLPAG
ncbi:ABC transporter permease [Micromonospora sp. NBC_01813]|uniref:ABC transporter permease n=1 Tax=Micromonospora sp. NBC_01813 TaxID=2975988 RepID=UPI002DDA5B29|nr:ABC transporter permease [Micromonospora sp. NBC_01813]WSA08687.1 ABC transporter permease [Micromonospora sp. NBC_01813]